MSKEVSIGESRPPKDPKEQEQEQDFTDNADDLVQKRVAFYTWYPKMLLCRLVNLLVFVGRAVAYVGPIIGGLVMVVVLIAFLVALVNMLIKYGLDISVIGTVLLVFLILCFVTLCGCFSRTTYEVTQADAERTQMAMRRLKKKRK